MGMTATPAKPSAMTRMPLHFLAVDHRPTSHERHREQRGDADHEDQHDGAAIFRMRFIGPL